MPGQRTQYVQLLVLLLALPAQYLLTQWSGANIEALRATYFQDMLRSMKQTVASTEAIVASVWQYFLKVSIFRLDFKHRKAARYKTPQTYDGGECVATEVFHHRSPNGYFARSTVIRSPRPNTVKYRVGQVVRHLIHGYRGVIIGWDHNCNAPNSWMDKLYAGDAAKQISPHYLILVDKRDRVDDRPTYVLQDNIVIVTNVVIKHDKLWDYFQLYDGAQFSMRPAMQQLYPHD